jgi:hypothetical protein
MQKEGMLTPKFVRILTSEYLARWCLSFHASPIIFISLYSKHLDTSKNKMISYMSVIRKKVTSSLIKKSHIPIFILLIKARLVEFHLHPKWL